MQEVTQVEWQDATRPHDVDWYRVHAVIGTMPDHEYGWYRGLFDAWTYVQAQVLNGKLRELVVDAPEGHMYSRYLSGGNIQRVVTFDPLKFLCMAAELDSEVAIVYVRFSKYESPFFNERSVRVHIASTESYYGLPKSWPKIAKGSDEEVWRPFKHAVKLNAWLAE